MAWHHHGGRDWSLKLGQIAQVFALEPPFVQQFGVGDSAIILRGFQQDANMQLVALGVEAVAKARSLGWRGDREEIVLFPTFQGYTTYRNALGLQTPTVPLPAGSAGDVLGQRVVMCSVPSLPAVLNDPLTGNQQVLAGGNNTANVFARLHSYVLLNALDEGGTGIPAYLQLGVEGLIARIIDGETLTNNYGNLVPVAQAGALLSPDQFNALETDPVRYQVAQLQASAILTYFYDEFGPGALVETIQRMGAGQTPDVALGATTEGTQSELFQSWRNAQFGAPRGPDNFPNAVNQGGDGEMG
ncbi:hypothetical protein EON80_10365 [bacterium]|nr:MAG: hypothetical protein EON80_10365 [bacterium]